MTSEWGEQGASGGQCRVKVCYAGVMPAVFSRIPTARVGNFKPVLAIIIRQTYHISCLLFHNGTKYESKRNLCINGSLLHMDIIACVLLEDGADTV